METKNRTTIQSLEVGFKIIDLIASQNHPLKFTNICESTGITKSNLYKYLNTLTHLGVLYREPKTGLYSLGTKLVEYGLHAIKNEDIVTKIVPFMEEINDEIDETVLLSVFTDNGPTVVQIIKNTTKLINIGADIGTVLPIFTSSGKIFAAYLDNVKARKWKENEFQKFPKEKINMIEEEIIQAKETGITFSLEPLAPSVSSISIPIFDFSKNLLAALTVVGFIDQNQQNNSFDLKEYMKLKSIEISKTFGFPS